jgi:hypothetical protein
MQAKMWLLLGVGIALSCAGKGDTGKDDTGASAGPQGASQSPGSCSAHTPDGEEWEITVHGMSTSTYIEGGSGWSGQFVIVDLTLRNTSRSEQTIYWASRLVDGAGLFYESEIGPCLQMDIDFGGDSTCMSAPTINPEQSQRGVLVFDVNDLAATSFALRVYAGMGVWDEDDYSCVSTL